MYMVRRNGKRAKWCVSFGCPCIAYRILRIGCVNYFVVCALGRTTIDWEWWSAQKGSSTI